MNLFGVDLLKEELKNPGYFFKAVLNDTGAAFFPGATEHCTVKIAGLSYEDNYKGNAIAAIITNGRIEIRNHRDFSSGRVTRIVQSLLGLPELRDLSGFTVLYRGEVLQ